MFNIWPFISNLFAKKEKEKHPYKHITRYGGIVTIKEKVKGDDFKVFIPAGSTIEWPVDHWGKYNRGRK